MKKKKEMEKNCQIIINDLDRKIKEFKRTFEQIQKYLSQQQEQNEKLTCMMKNYNIVDSEIVKFNVGGKIFSTYKSTLTKRIKKQDSSGGGGECEEYYEPNLLEGLISGICDVSVDENKAIFIDRNPQYFNYILDYLRCCSSQNNNNDKMSLSLPKNSEIQKDIFKEAEFYNLEGLKELISPNLEINILKAYLDTTILNTAQIKELMNLCNFKGTEKWKLLYRASVHGFLADDFHGKCDESTRTLTLIRTTQSYVFGGYTEAPWSQKGGYVNDPNAFIFSLVNKENKPIFIPCSQPPNAIYCNSIYGPTFGGGLFKFYYYSFLYSETIKFNKNFKNLILSRRAVPELLIIFIFFL